MMKKILSILFIISALPAQGLIVSVLNTNLHANQPLDGWAYDTADFPAGSWLKFQAFAVQTVSLDVATGEVVPAGTYSVITEAWEYDQTSSPTFFVVAGGATSTVATIDDRTPVSAASLWSTRATLVAATSFTNILCHYVKSPDTNSNRKVNVAGLAIYDDLNLVANKNGILANRATQTVAQANHRSPIPGNRIHNSSFEVGTEGWFPSAGARTNYAAAFLSTNGAFDGQYSLIHMATQAPDKVSFQGFLGRVATNMTHTFSAYYRGDGVTTNTKVIRLKSVTEALPDDPASPTFATSILDSSTNWQRLVLTVTNMTQYPSPYYYYELESQPTAVGAPGQGYVLWDAVQFEQGPTASVYAARRSLELGVTNAHKGNVFFDTDPLVVQLMMRSTITNNIYTNMHYEIYDGYNVLASTGCVYLAATGNVVRNDDWYLPTNGLGYFRCHYWLGNETNNTLGQESEFTYSVVQPPIIAALNPNSSLGTHFNTDPFYNEIQDRLGIRFGRTLSTASYFSRWTVVETNDRDYVYKDAELARSTNVMTIFNDLHTEGNGSSSQPDFVPNAETVWLISTTGVFQADEFYAGGGGLTGWIQSVYLDGEPIMDGFTGVVLQVVSNNAFGTTAGTVITGLTSAAVGTFRSGGADAMNFKFWKRFVTNVVNHYQPLGTAYWEIGNENKSGALWTTNANHFLAQFFKETEQSIRQVDTNAFVVAGGGWNGPTQSSNVIMMLNRSSGYSITNMQAWSLHNYPVGEDAAAGNPSFSFGQIKTNIIDALLAKGGIELWNTEAGYFDHGGYLFNNSIHAYQGIPIREWKTFEWGYKGIGTAPWSIQRNLLSTLGFWGMSNRTVHVFYDSRKQAAINLADSGHTQHTTSFDLGDIPRPKFIAYATLGRFLDGGKSLGHIRTPNTNMAGFAFGVTTNLRAVVYTLNDAPMLLDMSTDLAAGELISRDMWGNILSSTSQTVTAGRNMTMMEAVGVTTSVWLNAFTNLATAVADTVAPRLAVFEAPIGTVDGTLIDIRWGSIDNRDSPADTDLDAIQYSWRLAPYDAAFNDWSGHTVDPYPDLTNGNYTLTVLARDKSGNTSSVVRAFTVGGAPAAAGPGSGAVIGERGTQWPLRSWLWDRMP